MTEAELKREIEELKLENARLTCMISRFAQDVVSEGHRIMADLQKLNGG